MKKTIRTLIAASIVTGITVSAVAYFGIINVGADAPHSKIVYSFLTMARERSIEVRARDIEVPNLDDPAMIKSGAGNYNSMCVGCHLAPGIPQTELSQALYPAPPNLAKTGIGESPAAAFWVIKHGIKASGMPAWGKSMADSYIWGMVAFLQQLPGMDKDQYLALVASSAGHQHGGGESKMHNHEGQHGTTNGQTSPDHHASGDAAPEGAGHHTNADTESAEKSGTSSVPVAPAPSTNTHTHADGKEHKHEG
ncbi:c-type cytochrome [Pseudomonas sp. NPDC078700]|uniref:c-type cytochrome n=1 Tax=Pseudomonas sp. NPDC078700 TaxID=3364424 RepID=UPI0037C7D7F4